MKIKFLILMLLCVPLVMVHATKIANVSTADSIYNTVDQKPYLKNNRKGLDKQIRKTTVYPSLMKLQGVEGVVIVECVITSGGQMENCRIAQSVSPELDQEAIRVVSSLGPWVPANVNGIPVASQLSMPVPFSLSESDRNVVNALKPIDFQNKPPLFILDGKMVDGLINMESYNVRTIRVIKGSKAIDRYGDSARFGVVEITSKRGTPPVK